MDAAAELGRNPVSKHQIQPEYGDEQADARRDGRTRLARPNSQVRTGTGKYSIGNLTRLMLTLTICDDHTYIHIYIHTHMNTGCESIETTLRTRRLLWAGTLLRMSGGRLPKRIMFGNLEGAVRNGVGRRKNGPTVYRATSGRLA